MQFKFYGSEIIALMNAEKYEKAKKQSSIHNDMQCLDHENALTIHKNNVKKFEFYVKHIVDDNIYYLSESDLITYQLLVLD